jgi:tRNA G10  N-methylase Trm11
MVADAILDCSARGEVVLDGFLGSGTTVIAAERTGRRCFGIEIDPLYVDCAVRRWEAYTGARARHVETGRDFNDLAGEREAKGCLITNPPMVRSTSAARCGHSSAGADPVLRRRACTAVPGMTAALQFGRERGGPREVFHAITARCRTRR